MEADLLNWINNQRNQGICVSGFDIKCKAFELMDRSVQFRASMAGLISFCLETVLVYVAYQLMVVSYQLTLTI